ncbi:aminoacyl-tRNA hydrolase [Planctomycetota bacterium]
MAEVKMIVGLGNPGDEYVETRHNIGFRVLDCVAKALETKVKKLKFGARFGQAELADKKLILLKPQSFMNRSGQPIATAVGFYKITFGDLLVVLDDMALDVGRIRIRSKGSAGGHNGLADVIEKLGTETFARCRIGIGKSPEDSSVDFVLSKPTDEEKPILDDAVEKASDACIYWVKYGLETAMNKFNNA